MCGIVGMAGECSTKNHDDAFRQLLQVDMLRGRDSTGLATVGTDGSVSVLKEVGDAFNLSDSRRFDPLVQKRRRAIIGHNRYATIGGIYRKTAHPFDFDTLVGVHNGTLTCKHRLFEGNNFQVDSEALYHHIEQKGLKNALSELDGAWALVWWDKIEQTINFLRNKERPLFLSYGKAGAAVFWASEAWMLDGILSRNGIEHTEPKLLETDIHLSFFIGADCKLEKPHAVKAPSTYIAPVYTGMQSNKWNGGWKAPQNNVLQLPDIKDSGKGTPSKKSQSANAGALAGFNSSYVQSKQILIETLSLEKDEHGASYILCTDDENPYVELRLYVQKKDKIKDMVGVSIRADVSYCVQDAGKKAYFKLNPSSVKIVDTEGVKLFKSHKGEMLSKEEWEKAYSTCQWCTAPLVAGEKNGLTTEGQCLCPDCANDKEVQDYVSILPF